jgi:hypothetical protein
MAEILKPLNLVEGPSADGEEPRLPSFVEETGQLSQLIGQIAGSNGVVDVSIYLEVEKIVSAEGSELDPS